MCMFLFEEEGSSSSIPQVVSLDTGSSSGTFGSNGCGGCNGNANGNGNGNCGCNGNGNGNGNCGCNGNGNGNCGCNGNSNGNGSCPGNSCADGGSSSGYALRARIPLAFSHEIHMGDAAVLCHQVRATRTGNGSISATGISSRNNGYGYAQARLDHEMLLEVPLHIHSSMGSSETAISPQIIRSTVLSNR